MKLSINKTLENNIYGVKINFAEYGSPTMTTDEEKELIQDFAPMFNLKDVTFSGKYYYDEKDKLVKQYIEPKKEIDDKNLSKTDIGIQTEEDKKKEELQNKEKLHSEKEITKVNILKLEEIKDNLNLQPVSLVINDRIIILNETLELQYFIKSNQVLDQEVGNSLKDKGLVAQAKVQLFADKIIQKITEILEDLRQRKTAFEKKEEITL